MEWSGAIKNTNVELPDDLHRAVRLRALEEKKTARQAYQEALEAWLSQKSIPNSDDSGTTEKGAPPASTPAVNSGEEVQIPIPETDKPWVRKLLKVLHSPKPGLPTAVQNNLTEFVWADLAWDELRKHQSPLVSQTAGTGRRGAASGKLAPITGPGGDRGRDRDGKTRVTERLDALEKADERGEKRKKDAPGKTG